MKFMNLTRKLFAATFITLSGIYAQAQTITSDVYWDFGTAASPTSITPANGNMTVSNFSQGNNNGTTALLTATSASNTYTGASGGQNIGAAARIGALNTNAGGSAYFEVTFTPVGSIIIDNISFGGRSTSTGPQAYAIRTSLDGYASSAATGTINNNSAWTLFNSTLTNVAANGPITLRIYGYNGAGNAGASTANFRLDDITIHATASSAPLPVTFASFSLKPVQDGVQLNWATGTEKNTSRFEVQRSEDGKSFNAIGTVAARNIATGAQYSYTDRNVQGTAYYRLRIIDADEQFAYSDVLSYNAKSTAATVSLKANVVNGQLPVLVSTHANAVTLRIVNMAGIALQQQTIAAGTSSLINMDVNGLPAGMYLLQVAGQDAPQTFKFVKQ